MELCTVGDVCPAQFLCGTETMARLFRSVFKSDDGATAIEYGFLVAIIALTAMLGMGVLGNTLSNTLTGASNEMTDAGSG